MLFLEVYFLLRSKQSPIYFSLTDFVDNYSIELLYIAVTFSLLTGWLFIPAIGGYTVLVGSLAWCGRKFMGMFKCEGVPIFEALNQHNRENSVSIEVAKEYAKSNTDNDLTARIEKHEKESLEQLANEALATTNFALVILIAWISHSTGAPNFLMKVSSFADPFTFGHAYTICLALLVSQGLFGRAANFHFIRVSGSLPPGFFKNVDERKKVAGWTEEIVGQYKPLAEKWMDIDQR
ncbi:MAG: hypothetical protein U1A24_05340 [Cypionkella sp.]|nr:hypothetical protein [Cypionkella sp.]